ncbi:MAG: nitroreductase [Bacteroidetes bacterium]|nr:nitroreductase [Bacteroidota bacterium]
MENKVDIINQLIRTRRTVKPEKYAEKTVDKEIILNIVENAKWAPTHGLTQPWRFRIFYGKGLEIFGDFHAEAYRKSTTDETFKQKKYDQFKNRPLNSSALIAICMKRQKTEKIAEIEEIEAIACAVHNMHLTATAYGITCYWGTGGMTYSNEMKEFLGLDEKDKCLGLFHIGYPDIEWPEAKRNPASEYCEWIEE